MKNNQFKNGIILLFLIIVIAMSSIFLDNYNNINLDNILQPVFSKFHLLGTDQFGRDLLSRICKGTFISILIGLFASIISSIIGIILGLIAGYYKKMDFFIMRFVEIIQSFPTLLILIALISIFNPSIKLTVFVIGLVSWPAITRMVRGQVLKIQSQEYINAAKVIGCSEVRILFFHVFLNCLSPIIIIFTLNISNAIMFEAGLSFLGLGVQPPNPSLGRMINEGKDFILSAPNLFILPSIVLAIIVISFNLIGEGLREILETKK